MIETVISFAKAIGFQILNLEYSPIKGRREILNISSICRITAAAGRRSFPSARRTWWRRLTESWINSRNAEAKRPGKEEAGKAEQVR